MTQIDTFGAYVRRRLEHWGEEFALCRDVEYLGYGRKNILRILMEHKGMPGRATGFKPIETDALAQQIENVIADLAREQPASAQVMRAYYCGSGRRGVERYETALLLLAAMDQKAVSLRQYHGLKAVGDEFVGDRLLTIARAA